ncbi:hypothetical protein PC128_g25223, partial [Phytophthora cactorum]
VLPDGLPTLASGYTSLLEVGLVGRGEPLALEQPKGLATVEWAENRSLDEVGSGKLHLRGDSRRKELEVSSKC